VPENLLNSGDYTLDVVLIRNRSEIVLSEAGVVSFHVHDAPTGIEGWHWPIQGVVRPLLDWTSVPVADVPESTQTRPSVPTDHSPSNSMGA
jgi:hypothetical protein